MVDVLQYKLLNMVKEQNLQEEGEDFEEDGGEVEQVVMIDIGWFFRFCMKIKKFL